jgi:hypothetical protein
LTEEGFTLLWLDILLTITVVGLTKDWFICCGGFIVDHCCLSYDRGEVHIVVAGYIVYRYCLSYDRGVVHIVVAGYIVDHCCLSYDRGVVHIVVAGYIVDNYCFMFDRVVHIVVSVLLLNIIISGLTEECFIVLWLVILSTITV